MRNRNIIFTMIPFLFGYVALASTARGVLPAPVPDGGYLNGNTAEGGATTLHNLTSGHFNTAVGYYSLNSDTTGGRNTATGTNALRYNTTGSYNTATGTNALWLNTTGNFNTALGDSALAGLGGNVTGWSNVAIGATALSRNTAGWYNIAVGAGALLGNTNGNNNTATGNNALYFNADGNNNVAVGDSALQNATGSGNIAVGFQAGSLVNSSGHVIAIGSPGDDVDNSCFIGNIRGVQTQNANAIPVLIDSAGQLGTASSAQRFKKEIKPMEEASESILALQPVTFFYKNDKTTTPQFGLVAEEVAKVNPDLIVRDKDGEIYTVRYEAVNAMLLNEFLKEHHKVEHQDHQLQEQGAMITKQQKQIAQQQKQIEALAISLQKVSAQLEVIKSAPRTVLNH